MGGPPPTLGAIRSVSTDLLGTGAKVEDHKTGPAAEPVRSPQTPVTYNDIIRVAKKNAMMMPPSPMVPTSPESPQAALGQGQVTKRGILSGLAARRRSVKLTGKVIE